MSMARCICILLTAGILLSVQGCSKKSGPGEDKTGPAGSESAAVQSPPSGGEGAMSISDNPAYFQEKDLTAEGQALKDLDGAIRPKLVEILGGAKLVAVKQGDTGDTEILNTMTYVVRRLMDRSDGDVLHAALLEANFGKSPRYGGKPVRGRTTVMMSFFKNIQGRQYSIGISMDLLGQRITVSHFKPGSQYDRLL